MNIFYVYNNNENDYHYEAILNISHFDIDSIDVDIFNDIGYGKNEDEAISNLIEKIKITMSSIISILKEIYQETTKPCNKYKEEWHTILSEKYFELYSVDNIDLFKSIIGSGETKLDSLNNFLIAIKTIISFNSLSIRDKAHIFILKSVIEQEIYNEMNSIEKFFTDAGFNNYIE